VHGDGDGGNLAESAGVGMNVAGIPRGWIGQFAGIPAGMDFITAGTPREWWAN